MLDPWSTCLSESMKRAGADGTKAQGKQRSQIGDTSVVDCVLCKHRLRLAEMKAFAARK